MRIKNLLVISSVLVALSAGHNVIAKTINLPVQSTSLITTEGQALEENYFNTLSFDDLVKLSQNENEITLSDKVNKLLYNPYIDNSFGSIGASKIKVGGIGPYIRVAEWNIARGINLKEIEDVFDHSEANLNKIKDAKKLKKVKNELDILKNSDIIVLNEVDIGMPRTNYVNVAQELAHRYGYNYAFGLEFLEIDPVHLGLKDYKWSEERFLKKAGYIEDYKVDKDKYKGLHGNVILSKFPLENVRVIRLPKCYDWYSNEKEKTSKVEEVRRKAAEHVFDEGVFREIRLGSRVALVADVHIPTFNDKVTVVSTHLENRTEPKNRRMQMEFILQQIKDVKNPVVIAGDFNTLMADGSPTSVPKFIKSKITDWNFLVRGGIFYFTPIGWGVKALRCCVDFVRRDSDPTVKNIPILFPNKEKGLFNMMAKTQFNDGTTFDFGGNAQKSVSSGRNAKKILSDSNQRAIKGFVPTYRFERYFKFFFYKLDWIFVKAYSDDNGKDPDSVKFSPHYGRTLYDLNYAFDKPMSDHAPITVDLPLTDYKH